MNRSMILLLYSLEKQVHIKKNIGEKLNIAMAAIEEANLSSLEGVLKHIDFNKKVIHGSNIL